MCLSRTESLAALRGVRYGRDDDQRHHVPGCRRAGILVADHGSGVRRPVVDLLKPFMGNQMLLLAAIMVIVVIVGTALDMTPTILILTPILMPVIKQAGIDPVYFGVLFIVNNSIGLITPPVGVVLNVVAGVARIPMADLIRAVWPFMWAELVVLFLMVLFPALVTIPAKWLGG